MNGGSGWNKLLLLLVPFIGGILMGGLVGYHHNKSNVLMPIEEAVRRLGAHQAKPVTLEDAQASYSKVNNVTNSVPVDGARQKTAIVLSGAMLCLVICVLFIVVKSLVHQEDALEEEEDMQEVREGDRMDKTWSAILFIFIFFFTAVISFASVNRLLKAQMHFESEMKSLKKSMHSLFDGLGEASLPECSLFIENTKVGKVDQKIVGVRQYNSSSDMIKFACPRQSNVLNIYKSVHNVFSQSPFILLSLEGQTEVEHQYAIHWLDEAEIDSLSLEQCVLYKAEFTRLFKNKGFSKLSEPPTVEFMESL